MTKQILTILLLLPILAVAQNGTTLDEYRFLTKGYAYQKSMGLDAAKEGYDLLELAPTTNDRAFIGMYKTGATKPQAILLILERTTVSPTYVCIPNSEAPETVRHLHRMEEKRIAASTLNLAYIAALQALTFHLLEKESGNAVTTTTQIVPKEETFTSKSGSEGLDIVNKVIAGTTPSSYDLQARGENLESNATAINKSVAITIDEIVTKRAVLEAPVIRGTYMAKGKVAIKFCVDANGNVSSAKFTQLGSTTFNKALVEQAKAAVKKTTFASGNNIDCGKAVFHFQ